MKANKTFIQDVWNQFRFDEVRRTGEVPKLLQEITQREAIKVYELANDCKLFRMEMDSHVYEVAFRCLPSTE